jgi:hypothetical protein
VQDLYDTYFMKSSVWEMEQHKGYLCATSAQTFICGYGRSSGSLGTGNSTTSDWQSSVNDPSPECEPPSSPPFAVPLFLLSGPLSLPLHAALLGSFDGKRSVTVPRVIDAKRLSEVPPAGPSREQAKPGEKVPLPCGIVLFHMLVLHFFSYFPWPCP